MTKAEFEKYAAQKIEDAVRRAKFISDYWEKLEAAGVQFSNVDPFNYSSIDIDRPTREQVLAVIQAIPGKWEKEPTQSFGGALNYSLKVDGYTLRLWAAPPPPSCRLIEEEVEIPAQAARMEKRMRLECAPETEAA